MIPARAPQTMIQEHVVTGARFTCTCYRIGDLALQYSEGTEATFRLRLPTSKWLDSEMLYVGRRLLSIMFGTFELFEVSIRVGSSYIYLLTCSKLNCVQWVSIKLCLHIADFGACVWCFRFVRFVLSLIHRLLFTITDIKSLLISLFEKFDHVRQLLMFLLDVLGLYSLSSSPIWCYMLETQFMLMGVI